VTLKGIRAFVLAAGRGVRMYSDRVKVLHEAADHPLLGHVVETIECAGIRNITVVVGSQAREVRSFLNGKVDTVLQTETLGTAHAVLAAKQKFRSWFGDLLVVPGDAPCLKAETLRAMIRNHLKQPCAASVLTAEIQKPSGYGRIIRQDGDVLAIREELDASPSERKIKEINSGIYLFCAQALLKTLSHVQKNKRKQEYYLTDVIQHFRETGERVLAYRISDATEILGVNTRLDLARVHEVITNQELERHSKNGVTIVNPKQTVIAKGVTIGRDTTIHPFTWIGRGVTIGRKCEIGPYAKIHSGSSIGEGATIGSFVEVVRSKIGKSSRVKHLTYLGDTEVGKGVNVGAGTITANYDGKAKQKTVIEDQVFLGCDTILVAPVRVKKKAKTGAGTVVLANHSVPRGRTVVGVPAKLINKKKHRTK
jgi:bifunctional UDP-N-acetylglucosamine pyrophosphorylase / glucosamine-1-phosphate N-acetyltransferase